MAGLRNLKSPGPGSKFTARQQAELPSSSRPDPGHAVHGVVRWRRVDLRDELQRRFGVTPHQRSVGKVLAKLGYRKMSVRLRHQQADEEAQEISKNTLPRQLRRKSLTAPKATQQGTLTRVWAKRGTSSRTARPTLRLGLPVRRSPDPWASIITRRHCRRANTNCRCCCVCGLVDDVLEQLRMVAVRVVAAHDLASLSSPLALLGCPACLDRVCHRRSDQGVVSDKLIKLHNLCGTDLIYNW